MRQWFVRQIALTSILLAAEHAQAQAPAHEQAPQVQPREQPPNPVADLEEDARLHFQLGRRAFQRAEFEDAAREFDIALQLSHRDELHYDLYLCYREMGDAPRAAEHLRIFLPTVTDEARRESLQARLDRLERSLTAGAPSTDDAAPPATGRSIEVTPWIIAGSGGLLVAVGAVVGVLALGDSSSLDQMCTPTCPESARDTASRGRALAITSDTLWITGAVAAAVGVVWGIIDVIGASSSPPPVTAACDGQGCMVQMVGSL